VKVMLLWTPTTRGGGAPVPQVNEPPLPDQRRPSVVRQSGGAQKLKPEVATKCQGLVATESGAAHDAGVMRAAGVHMGRPPAQAVTMQKRARTAKRTLTSTKPARLPPNNNSTDQRSARTGHAHAA
jgi:hypothetical protein